MALASTSSTWAPMPCFPQKSSISCVSAIPPILDPAMERLFVSRENGLTTSDLADAPMFTRVPSIASSPQYASRSMLAGTVDRIRSNDEARSVKMVGSEVTR